jgi:hypothetical protein
MSLQEPGVALRWRNTLTTPQMWPGAIWDGLTQPYHDVYDGMMCDDMTLMASGVEGVGYQVVGLAGTPAMLKSIGRWLQLPRHRCLVASL